MKLLDPREGMTIVDATVGAGGHAVALLRRVCPGGGFLLGLDRDPQAADIADQTLRKAGFRRGQDYDIEVARFSRLDEVMKRRGLRRADRILADLGVCSLHLDSPERGFSFKHEGPLDMRLDASKGSGPTAADIVNTASEAELARLFYEFGEERWSRRIARAIVESRGRVAIRTTTQLREIVAGAIPRRHWPPSIDPATRVFQALRIAVNEELEELDAFLSKLPEVVECGGRVGVITFHSLEDRRVKRAFRRLAQRCHCPPEWPMCRCDRVARWRELTRKPVTASPEEIARNPRSRSAKLRVAERIERPSLGRGAAADPTVRDSGRDAHDEPRP